MSQPSFPTETIDVLPQQVLQAQADGSALLVDVREPYEYDAGHIDGAVPIPLGELAPAASGLPRDRPVVAVCRVGGRSGLAARLLRDAGVQAHSMAGGMLAWDAEGLPMVPDPGARVAEH